MSTWELPRCLKRQIPCMLQGILNSMEVFLLVMFFSGKFIPICSVQQQEALDKKRLFAS